MIGQAVHLGPPMVFFLLSREFFCSSSLLSSGILSFPLFLFYTPFYIHDVVMD